MMLPAPSLTLVIEDRQIPRTHAKLLTLLARGRATVPVAVRLVSEMGLPLGERWEVKPEVAARLAAKLALLQDSHDAGISVYIDGSSMIVGDLAELLPTVSVQRFVAGKTLPLRDLAFFAVNHEIALNGSIRQQLRALSDGGYSAVADFVGVSFRPLPDRWQFRPFGAVHGGNAFDFRSFGQRPWYSPWARAAGVWSEMLIAAASSGIITLAEVEADIANGWMRPSILYQLQHGIADSRQLPSGLLDLDREFKSPETIVTRQQRAMIRRKLYPVPTRPGETLRKLQSYASLPWRALKRATRLVIGERERLKGDGGTVSNPPSTRPATKDATQRHAA